MNLRPRAIVFDLDGTLIDSYAAITRALNAARAHAGLDPVPVDRVRREVGHGLEELIARHLGPERVAEGVRVFRETYPRVMLELTRPLPGVPDVPRAMARRGLLLGVATNKPARFALPLLEAVGLADVIRAVQGPGDGLPAKPDPAILNDVLGRLGVGPGETLYVGDMPLDVESGRRAGVPTWLVATGSADRAELDALGSVPVFSDLFTLDQALIRSGAG